MRKAATFLRILEMKLGFEFKRKWMKMFFEKRLERACLNDDGKIPPKTERLTSL